MELEEKLEEKKEYIINMLTKNLVSQRKIDGACRGKYARKLLAKEKVPASRIESMYLLCIQNEIHEVIEDIEKKENLVEFDNTDIFKKVEKEIDDEEANENTSLVKCYIKTEEGSGSENIQDILKRIQYLEEENMKIKARISLLENNNANANIEEYANIEEPNENINTDKNTYRLYLGTTISNGKSYKTWYARQHASNKKIYIGKDKTKAQEKIKAWEEKNNENIS